MEKKRNRNVDTRKKKTTKEKGSLICVINTPRGEKKREQLSGTGPSFWGNSEKNLASI